MAKIQEEARFLHILPGRARIEIFGLKDNRQVGTCLIGRLYRMKGMGKVSFCTATGRALVYYDPVTIDLAAILDEVRSLEQQIALVQPPSGRAFLQAGCAVAMDQVASALEGPELHRSVDVPGTGAFALPAGVRCIPLQGDEDKLWILAASLLKKTGHPWREEIMRRAQDGHGTVRTAYKIQETGDGVMGEINSRKIYLGDPKLLEQNNINCAAHQLEIKRNKRAGYQVECLAREQEVLGLFIRPQASREWEIPQTELGGTPWHALPAEEALRRLKAEEVRGLTGRLVRSRKKLYGLNQLEQKRPVHWLQAYLAQFKEFTTLVILGTTALAFISGNVFDGLAMGTILLVNAAIGMLQERKAEKIIETLDRYQPPQCQVIRDNRQREIPGTELVPGDVVILEAGDRVPADIRLIRAWNLEANEAALTGESVPVSKDVRLLQPECALGERSNMLFMGTDVTRGKGLGVVVKTGMQTEFGYLMSLMKGQDKLLTPLHEKVTRIAKVFVKGAAIAGGIVLVAGLWRGRPLTEMITTSITMAASAVPEGLPVTITIALSAGIYRMAKQNTVIRKLSALATLGRTTVICTDKTGTLTKNEMTVRRIATINRDWQVTGEGYEPSGQVLGTGGGICRHGTDRAGENPELKRLMQIAMLCNNSKLEQDNGGWRVKGDPTEGALIAMAAKYELWPGGLRQWHRVHEVPFDSNSGTMTVVCQDREREQECYLLAKGAVETIIDACRWYQQDGEIRPLTEIVRQRILRQNSSYAQEALRVLGFGYAPLAWQEGENTLPENNLIYVGLVGMIDPPKPEVEKSIREALALGVAPVMITGDHPITAIAIAKELGLGDQSSRILTGQELDQLSDAELAATVENTSIFARVTPEHKLRIVKAYQQRGHIVAMTGDGVNDTPAINQANVGIAMGKTGTEVTKATADMILKKDHFGSILEGVKEGRTIIGNIRRAIGCLLTGNLAEILVSATAVLIGLPVPLVPIQILLMNLLTDAIPAMVLAVNPNSKIKQTEKVDIADRELYQKVIARGILLGAGSLGLFATTLASGQPLAVAQTVAFTALVLGQLAQTFSWRREGTEAHMTDPLQDRYLLSGLAASSAALLISLYLPPVARFFHSTPIGIRHWLSVLLVVATVALLSQPLFVLVARISAPKQETGRPLTACPGALDL